jgi:biotin operon repressor
VQPAGYGVTGSVDPEALVAEQDAIQRTMARLSENLRVCLLLAVIGQFSTSEIAEMLDLEEAAVRQRLARARKQFQHFYALESGEELLDQAASATTGDVETAQERRDRQQNHIEHVENHLSTAKTEPSFLGRNYAERVYREPAATPLW